MYNFKFFASCKSIEEVKKVYRALCFEHHPDKGGNLATMQAINEEYTKAINYFASGAKNTTTEETANTILEAELYRQALEKVAHLEGLIVELVGNWIWLSGNTLAHREAIKDAGFYWAKLKKMWYFRSEEYRCKATKKLTIEQIRAKYGSQFVNKGYNNRLTA